LAARQESSASGEIPLDVGGLVQTPPARAVAPRIVVHGLHHHGEHGRGPPRTRRKRAPAEWTPPFPNVISIDMSPGPPLDSTPVIAAFVVLFPNRGAPNLGATTNSPPGGPFGSAGVAPGGSLAEDAPTTFAAGRRTTRGNLPKPSLCVLAHPPIVGGDYDRGSAQPGVEEANDLATTGIVLLLPRASITTTRYPSPGGPSRNAGRAVSPSNYDYTSTAAP